MQAMRTDVLCTREPACSQAPGPDGGALLAAAVRGGAWRLLPLEPGVPEPHRLQHLAFFAGGGVAVHLFSLYASADGTAAARATCVALCEAALAAAVPSAGA